MKEEVARILKLVQEGKLSAEDAAELIDSFQRGDDEPPVEAPAEEGTADGEAKQTPPPPPDGKKDPFKSFTDFVNNLEREVRESVDWKEVANQAKLGAQKGMDALKKAAEEIKAGNVSVGLFGTSETREVTLPLSVGKGKTLVVENPCGSVKITGGAEEGSVSAKAKVRGASVEDAKAKAEAYTLVVEESDHSVIIRQPRTASLHVDLVVQLKGKTAIEVKTESGNVEIADTNAGAKVNSQSGNVTVRGLDGALDINAYSGDVTVADVKSPSCAIESKSGDITLTKVKGNLNMRIASGEIALTDCHGKSISIESVSGNVDADFSQPITGTLNVRTVNGDASLKLPDGCDCRVSLSTLRGEVECDLTLTDEAKSDQRITGRLGEGTGSIDVSGINGDILVRLRDSGAAS